jgi:plastocyanin
MRRFWLLAVLVGAAGLIAAAPHHSAAKVYSITVNNLAYAPGTITAHVGDTVQWINKDMFLHSATAADKSFDVTLKPNPSGGMVLKRPGVISYICRYHPGMKGQILVQK